jgi:hypothetical protein
VNKFPKLPFIRKSRILKLSGGITIQSHSYWCIIWYKKLALVNNFSQMIWQLSYGEYLLLDGMSVTTVESSRLQKFITKGEEDDKCTIPQQSTYTIGKYDSS